MKKTKNARINQQHTGKNHVIFNAQGYECYFHATSILYRAILRRPWTLVSLVCKYNYLHHASTYVHNWNLPLHINKRNFASVHKFKDESLRFKLICLCVYHNYFIFSFVLNSYALKLLLFLMRITSKLLVPVSDPLAQSIK